MPPDWLASPFRKAVIPAAGRESHEDAREALLDSNLASDEDDKGYPPEETSNPQKLRTRRQAPPVTVARATARLVGGVLLFILVGFTLSQVDWSRTPAIVGEGCTSNFLAMDRADPSFWSIEIDPAVRHLNILPRDPVSYFNCTQLADAYFTVRLHFSSGDSVLLADPTQPQLGQYRFDLKEPVGVQTSEEVKVEAVLELAWFPGGLEGMPCGKEATACNTTLMVAEGREWSGKEILDDSGKRVTYQNVLPPISSASKEDPLCTSFDPLPGFWNNDTLNYTPLDPTTHLPCRFLTITPTTTSQTYDPSPRRRWIRFLGDSNTRYFFWWTLAIQLGAKDCIKTNREISYMCWTDTTVFTYTWWFYKQLDPERYGPKESHSEDQLAHLLDQPFQQFLTLPGIKSDPWNRTSGLWPSHFDDFAEAPEMFYISLGSHSWYSTTEGVRQTMEKMLLLFEPIKDSIVLALTSSTGPDKTPEVRRNDTVIRHDVMIEARNKVISEYAREAGIRVIDFFSITRTAGVDLMIDQVHFKMPMYDLWCRIFLTRWLGGVAAEQGL